MSEHVNTFGARLRSERERQGIGVRELSRRLDVSASMISQIEHGRVMPSVNTLYSITSALGLSLDDLFRPPDGDQPAAQAPVEQAAEGDGDAPAQAPRNEGPVVRRERAQALGLSSGVTWELLTAQPDSAVDFLRAIYEPGSESSPASALMRHQGREYGTVIEGTLNVTVGFETFELRAGDSISFDSSIPHRLFNTGDETVTAIWVVVGRAGDPRQSGRAAQG